MIEITYHRHRHEVRAAGHAGYGPEGQDIVCAAVTALSATLAQFAAANGGGEIRMEPGDIYVRCRCRSRYDAPVTLVFNTIAGGLAGLAEQWPEYVRMDIFD